MTGVLAPKTVNPVVTIVFKDAGNLPAVEDVVRNVADGIRQFLDRPMELRTHLFNIFVEPGEGMSSGLAESKACLIFCPRSEKENSRVHRIAAKASKQLSSGVAATLPGVLILGVTHYQDTKQLAGLLRQRFDGGQYAGISGAVLIQAGTNMEAPLRAPLDLLATLRNPRAARAHPNMRLQPVGLIGQLSTDPSVGLPAYRHHVNEAVYGGGPCSLFLPATRVLSPQMLA
jgi:hypothetical protein